MKTDNPDDSRLLFKVRDEDISDKKKPQMNAPIRVHEGKIMGVSGVPASPESKGTAGKQRTKTRLL